MIAGIQPGGQLTITTEVENYPGFAEAIQGPWLMEQMQAQAEHVGTQVRAGHDRRGRSRAPALRADRRFRRRAIRADTLIIATGAQANWLGLASEEKFKGFGVSACATCDGFFFRGKSVAVVGGGNTAAEEALFLTNFAEQRDAHPSPRRAARRQDQPDAPRRQPEDRRALRHRRRRGAGRGRSATVSRHPPAQPRQRRDGRRWPSTGFSSPSAIRRRRNCFNGQLDMDDGRLHPHRAGFDAHQRARACSRPAT